MREPCDRTFPDSARTPIRIVWFPNPTTGISLPSQPIRSSVCPQALSDPHVPTVSHRTTEPRIDRRAEHRGRGALQGLRSHRPVQLAGHDQWHGNRPLARHRCGGCPGEVLLAQCRGRHHLDRRLGRRLHHAPGAAGRLLSRQRHPLGTGNRFRPHPRPRRRGKHRHRQGLARRRRKHQLVEGRRRPHVCPRRRPPSPPRPTR